MFLFITKNIVAAFRGMQWQHSEEFMCRLQNIDMRDYQESATTGQTDAGQSDLYVPLCFAGDTKISFIYSIHS